jgi:hypothetical protein
MECFETFCDMSRILKRALALNPYGREYGPGDHRPPSSALRCPRRSTTWHTATVDTDGDSQPIPSGERAAESIGAAAARADLEHFTTEICRAEGWRGFPPRPVLHDAGFTGLIWSLRHLPQLCDGPMKWANSAVLMRGSGSTMVKPPAGEFGCGKVAPPPTRSIKVTQASLCRRMLR